MIHGINFITDEKGTQKGIILDLPVLKKYNIKASQVLDALSGLQELIDSAEIDPRKAADWDLAKENLKNLHP